MNFKAYSLSHISWDGSRPPNIGSQDWREEFRKTTFGGGMGVREGHFRFVCEVSQLNLTRTEVIVTLVGTDLATLPTQCWFTRLARRIPKNNIERGRTFSTWLSSVSTKLAPSMLTRTVATL